MNRFLKDLLPTNWKQLAAWLAFAAAAALGSRFGLPPAPVPPPPLPDWPVENVSFVAPPDGWRNDPDAVEEVARTLGFKVFGDTAAGQSQDPLPQQVFLWEAVVKATGKLPPAKNQNPIGSCVSFGTNNAIVRTLAVTIALGGAFEWKDIAEEVTYAGSRVEVGGGKISGDGSVGAWAAKFVQRWGVLPREKVGSHDLSRYDPNRCRAWGRTGVPDELEPFAKEHPVRDITLVKTWEQAKKALASGYGIAICSDAGFTMQRDANGVARASGRWAHCMCLDGYCQIEGKDHGHIENSWGPDAHRGPVGPGNPSTAGFWAAATTIERMLAQGDSWAFSNVKGFPSRKLDWFVHNRKAGVQILARERGLRPILSLEGSRHAFSHN